MPPLGPGLRQHGVSARRIAVLMPEAPVNEDGLAETGKDKVWPSGQVAPVKAEAKAPSMGQSPHGKLRHSVLSPNTRHQGGPLFGRHSWPVADIALYERNFGAELTVSTPAES